MFGIGCQSNPRPKFGIQNRENDTIAQNTDNCVIESLEFVPIQIGTFNIGSPEEQNDASLRTDFLVLAGVGYALPNSQGFFIESSSIVADSTTLTIESGYTKMLGSTQVDLYALKDFSQDNAWQVAMGFAYRFR